MNIYLVFFNCCYDAAGSCYVIAATEEEAASLGEAICLSSEHIAFVELIGQAPYN